MDAFYTFALSFAAEHLFLTWCALWLAWLPLLALNKMLPIITRIYRVIMVSLRGWPPAHLDADGDWRPAPKKVDEKTETTTAGGMSHTVKTRTESAPIASKVRAAQGRAPVGGNPDWDPAPGPKVPCSPYGPDLDPTKDGF